MTWGLSLKKGTRRLTAALLFLLILMPLRSGAAELPLLHINDSHGHLWSEEGKGNFAVLAYLVDAIGRGGTGSRQLAEARIEGLDLIVDGHSHILFTEAQKIGHTPGAQAGWAGEALGRFNLAVREGTLSDWSWRAVAVDEEGPKDTEMAARLRYYRWQGSRKTRGPIGETEQDLLGDREKVRSDETNLSPIVTDSMREVTGADLAVLNGGTICDSIAAGPVSLRDGMAVLPFGNDLVIVDLSGDELTALASSLARIPAGTGAYPQVSGLRCVIDGTTQSELLIDGELPVGDRTYRVATISGRGQQRL